MAKNRSDILDDAKCKVCGPREAQYGDPRIMFNCVSRMFQDYTYLIEKTDRCWVAQDAIATQILLKIARLAVDPTHKDSWVDIAGYAALGGELSGE